MYALYPGNNLSLKSSLVQFLILKFISVVRSLASPAPQNDSLAFQQPTLAAT
jgi:hypothetical protein